MCVFQMSLCVLSSRHTRHSQMAPRLARQYLQRWLRFIASEGKQAVFSTSGRLLNFAGFQRWASTSPVLSWSLDANTDDALCERFQKLGPLEVADTDESRIALPRLGGVDEPEFVALLWTLLLALSSLVRYEPARWKAAIDPDSSRLAVPVEQLCDFAETFVPRILNAMLAECE